MATERVKYLGKRELTIKEFEALDTLNPNIDYNLTDFPQFYITNEQMTFALTCKRLFNIGSTFICADEGNYSKGHIYQIIGNPKTWEDITVGANVDEITIDKNINGNLQTIGITDGTSIDTFKDIDDSLTIERL